MAHNRLWGIMIQPNRKKLKKFFGKLKPKKNKWDTIIFILVIVTILMVGMLYVNLPKNNNQIYKVGTFVEVKNIYEFNLKSFEQDDILAQRMRLADGKTVITLEAEIKNNSKRKMDFIPMANTYLRNDQGDNFVVFPDLKEPLIPSGTMNPGEKYSGKLSFIVDKKDGPLWFYLDTHFLNTPPLVYKIR